MSNRDVSVNKNLTSLEENNMDKRANHNLKHHKKLHRRKLEMTGHVRLARGSGYNKWNTRQLVG